MSILWWNLLLAFGFSFLARYFAKPAGLTPYVKPNRLMVLCAMATLIFAAGMQSNIGDTFYYMHSYKTVDFHWQSIDYSGDFGFNLYQMGLQQFSSDPQILILVTALLTNLLIVSVLAGYSRLLEISVFVYITSGMFITSMNGIRQYLAAAIVFTAIRFLIKGQFWRYLLVILFAATIHKTALILIPIYFIVRRRAWTWQTAAILLAAVAVVFGFNQFTSILFSVIEDTQYAGYKTFSEGGANVLRVVVDGAPMIFAFLGRERLRRDFTGGDVIVNMSLIGLVFMIIATQNWIFARFAIYFGLYQLILITWIFHVFRHKDKKLIYYGVLVFYFVFYFYENVITLGLTYKSNWLPWLY
ncbi:EpsG family protein [Paenibacillus gansuensis]|uniref:EpsG family protein n=1 Tax=Paenibacillus gansuensis TaxID=306542 RepID=A0ABW5PHF2_9BACL